MIQGDVYWLTFRKPDKRRPVLILTRSDAIPELNSVTVSSITTTVRDLKSHVWLDEDDGMPEQCAVNLDNIQTVSKDKIGSYITHLSNQRMSEVFQAIKFAFKLDK